MNYTSPLMHRLRLCAFFLVQDLENPSSNNVIRKPIGTGFFVACSMEDRLLINYLVTARHLIEGSRSGGPIYLRYNNAKDSEIEYADVELPPHDDWQLHPLTDVAVL